MRVNREPASLHVEETEAARSSGYQEVTISENFVDDRKKASVSVLPQHRPAIEALLGAATDTAVAPPCRAHHRLRAHQTTPDAAAAAWQAIDAHVFAACVESRNCTRNT